MAQQIIDPKNPPIVWSTVEEAFTKINANFDEIYATIGGELGSVVDFTNLNSSLSPSINEVYDLGSSTRRWRDLYLSGSSLYLGNAQISADFTGAVNLPAGSTVGGQLIRNPAESSFKNIVVSGQDTIEADEFTDTVTLASGNAGINITTNSFTDTVTISNSGILGVTGTSNQIGASTVNGIVTLTNLGVLSLVGEIGGIGVSASTGDVTITNLGVKRIVAGSGISITPVGGTGNVTIENTLPASPTFRTIRVDGDFINQVQADPGNFNDTLNFTSGPGITITPNASTDTITFTVNSNLDIRGSVFGGDSSTLVDGTSGRIVGPVYTSVLRTSELSIALGDDAGASGQSSGAVAIGDTAGNTNQSSQATAVGQYAAQLNQGTGATALGTSAGSDDQGARAVAVGSNAGQTTQGSQSIGIGWRGGNYQQGINSIAVGTEAGESNQGNDAIAIGRRAGYSGQTANSIVLNASGSAVNGSAAGFYVRPVRSNSSGRIAIYDTSTYEVSYTNLEFNGGLISTADSSGISIDVLTTFNTDVLAENDLTVTHLLTTDKLTTNTLSATSLTISQRLTVNGNTLSKAVQSAVTPLSGATGVVVHDYSLGSTFRHLTPAANFTVNLTNMNLSNGFITQVRLIIVQGITPQVPTAVQIDGVAQSLLWKDNSPPAGNANKRDVVLFTISNLSGAYIVLGELSTYG